MPLPQARSKGTSPERRRRAHVLVERIILSVGFVQILVEHTDILGELVNLVIDQTI